jgi:hypothetical protein
MQRPALPAWLVPRRRPLPVHGLWLEPGCCLRQGRREVGQHGTAAPGGAGHHRDQRVLSGRTGPADRAASGGTRSMSARYPPELRPLPGTRRCVPRRRQARSSPVAHPSLNRCASRSPFPVRRPAAARRWPRMLSAPARLKGPSDRAGAGRGVWAPWPVPGHYCRQHRLPRRTGFRRDKEVSVAVLAGFLVADPGT